MSYWVSLEIDTGGTEPATVDERPGNYTSNVSGMWTKALGLRLRELDGTGAVDAIPRLRAAVERMSADPDAYRALNPENGWGNYEGARDYLASLLAACVDHPKAHIRVSC